MWHCECAAAARAGPPSRAISARSRRARAQWEHTLALMREMDRRAAPGGRCDRYRRPHVYRRDGGAVRVRGGGARGSNLVGYNREVAACAREAQWEHTLSPVREMDRRAAAGGRCDRCRRPHRSRPTARPQRDRRLRAHEPVTRRIHEAS